MVFQNLNIGTSVFKREAKPIDDVVAELRSSGWQRTGTLGNRIVYMENSKIGITVIDGARGTVIIPSGPIRGRMFGESGFQTNDTSVIGAGAAKQSDDEVSDQQAGRKLEQIT